MNQLSTSKHAITLDSEQDRLPAVATGRLDRGIGAKHRGDAERIPGTIGPVRLPTRVDTEGVGTPEKGWAMRIVTVPGSRNKA